MKIKKLSNHEFSKFREKFHCLTYAEEGFAPLNQFTKSFDIDNQALVSGWPRHLDRCADSGLRLPAMG